jgi:hypothetical protein
MQAEILFVFEELNFIVFQCKHLAGWPVGQYVHAFTWG